MLIRVFTPTTSRLSSVSLGSNSNAGDLLKGLWAKQRFYFEDERIKFSQLSLRSLVYPVSLGPRDTIRTVRKRVANSARVEGWVGVRDQDNVPSSWNDTDSIHVYVYIDQGQEMLAAEGLYEQLWGKDLNLILREISVEGTTWKYVPKENIDHLQMRKLGYREESLLIRPEYETALAMFGYESAKDRNCGGVVVTGQPGIGKSCFRYYLLFCKLSKATPVALELHCFIIVFQDDGVYRHPLSADPDLLPQGTWALAGSHPLTDMPCSAFLHASGLQIAWIVQTTPLSKMPKGWQRQLNMDTFIMDYFSIQEMTPSEKCVE